MFCENAGAELWQGATALLFPTGDPKRHQLRFSNNRSTTRLVASAPLKSAGRTIAARWSMGQWCAASSSLLCRFFLPAVSDNAQRLFPFCLMSNLNKFSLGGTPMRFSLSTQRTTGGFSYRAPRSSLRLFLKLRAQEKHKFTCSRGVQRLERIEAKRQRNAVNLLLKAHRTNTSKFTTCTDS